MVEPKKRKNNTTSHLGREEAMNKNLTRRFDRRGIYEVLYR